MTEQWQELKDTIIELRDGDGTTAQQEVCKFLANLMDVLEKQMQESVVSKQVVIDIVDSYSESQSNVEDVTQDIISDIVALPPVTPQPCEDAIGRSDMLDAIGHGTTYTSEELQKIIKALPSVNPQPKTGYWILTSDDDYEYCTCSECGYQNGENWMIGSQIKYCQECGAKMQEVEE